MTKSDSAELPCSHKRVNTANAVSCAKDLVQHKAIHFADNKVTENNVPLNLNMFSEYATNNNEPKIQQRCITTYKVSLQRRLAISSSYVLYMEHRGGQMVSDNRITRSKVVQEPMPSQCM